jgi:hypothetical protein
LQDETFAACLTSQDLPVLRVMLQAAAASKPGGRRGAAAAAVAAA